jgi:hypothetical protein
MYNVLESENIEARHEQNKGGARNVFLPVIPMTYLNGSGGSYLLDTPKIKPQTEHSRIYFVS